MPGVVFYYDQEPLKEYFKFYTGGDHWNSAAAITDADKGGPNAFALTEAGILDTLRSKASAYASTEGVSDGKTFSKLILDIANGVNKEYTIYVLKSDSHEARTSFLDRVRRKDLPSQCETSRGRQYEVLNHVHVRRRTDMGRPGMDSSGVEEKEIEMVPSGWKSTIRPLKQQAGERVLSTKAPSETAPLITTCNRLK